MKRKIVALTAALVVLSSSNALAATKNCSLSNGRSYKYSMQLNFDRNNCLDVADIQDLMNCYFNGNCKPNCNKNDCTNSGCTRPNKPSVDCPSADCPSVDKPSVDRPSVDKPSVDVPSTDKPSTDKPSVDVPSTDKPSIDKPSEDSPSSSTEDQYAAEVVRLVNEERAKEGLSALKTNTTAQSAALVRAKETVTSFSHTRPNGSSCFTALDEAGLRYSGAGENIAYGQRTPAAVVDAWMNSPGHRANIMNGNFSEIGVGCYKSGNTYYWAQFFIS